ncbi:MAG: hypothetical protein R2865_14050 [Deinococcales bacterium]
MPHYLDWLLLHFQDEEPELFCHLQNTKLYAGDADSHAKVILRPKGEYLIDVELNIIQAFPSDMADYGNPRQFAGDVHRNRVAFIDLAHLPPRPRPKTHR